MRQYLRHFDKYNTILVLDSLNGKKVVQSSTPDENTSGWYYNFENEFIGIFSNVEELYVYFNRSIYPLNESLSIKYSRKGRYANLSLRYMDDMFSTYYKFNLPVSTLWYSEDDEDVDFGLWLYNIINSPERKKIFTDSNKFSDDI